MVVRQEKLKDGDVENTKRVLQLPLTAWNSRLSPAVLLGKIFVRRFSPIYLRYVLCTVQEDGLASLNFIRFISFITSRRDVEKERKNGWIG
jgi:hypothetical protein